MVTFISVCEISRELQSFYVERESWAHPPKELEEPYGCTSSTHEEAEPQGEEGGRLPQVTPTDRAGWGQHKSPYMVCGPGVPSLLVPQPPLLTSKLSP